MSKQTKQNQSITFSKKLIATEEKYLVLDHQGKTIRTHQKNPMPALSLALADLLIEDLTKALQEQKIKTSAFTDESLRNSMVYCILSTRSEEEGDNYDYDIHHMLQWDQAFRPAAGPPLLIYQLEALAPIRGNFNFQWPNLMMNYAQSIEEMHSMNVDFVPEAVVDQFRQMKNRLGPLERYIIWFLWQTLDRFSVSLIMLWVTGTLNSKQLLEAYLLFAHGLCPDERDKEEKSYTRFLKNRLEYLRKLQEIY